MIGGLHFLPPPKRPVCGESAPPRRHGRGRREALAHLPAARAPLQHDDAVTPQELRSRFDRFADDVIRLCRAEARDPLRLRLLVQLQDAATSAAANYRPACRAQSKPAFIAKLSVVLEETDEALGWLQRLSNGGIGEGGTTDALLQEAGELAAIINASRETARGRRRSTRRQTG